MATYIVLSSPVHDTYKNQSLLVLSFTVKEAM